MSFNKFNDTIFTILCNTSILSYVKLSTNQLMEFLYETFCLCVLVYWYSDEDNINEICLTEYFSCLHSFSSKNHWHWFIKFLSKKHFAREVVHLSIITLEQKFWRNLWRDRDQIAYSSILCNKDDHYAIQIASMEYVLPADCDKDSRILILIFIWYLPITNH